MGTLIRFGAGQKVKTPGMVREEQKPQAKKATKASEIRAFLDKALS